MWRALAIPSPKGSKVKKKAKKPAAPRRTRTPKPKPPPKLDQLEAMGRIIEITRARNDGPHPYCSFCMAHGEKGTTLDGVKLTIEHKITPYYFLCLKCARAIGAAAHLPKAAAK
jgi:hypothetical protein